MTMSYDEQRLAELIRLLAPPPEAWARAAQELPRARATLDGLVQRAEADAEFRSALVADLEATLVLTGIEPSRALVVALRRRLDTV